MTAAVPSGGPPSPSLLVPVAVIPEQAGTKMLEFFGGDKGNLFAEWQSGDQLRQNQALIQRCHGVCQSQQAVVHQLEAQARSPPELAPTAR